MHSGEKVLIALILVAAAVVAFGGSVNSGFVWDDNYLVANNPLVRAPLWKMYIFRQDILGSGFRDTLYYRPVQIFSYALEYRLWGLRPWLFHLTGLITHILNSILVFVVAFKLCGNKPAALITALLFAVHPSAAGVVSYVSGRADLLMFFFGMAYLLCHIHYVKNGNVRVLCWGCAALLMALLSKEHAVVFPVIALFYNIEAPSGKRERALKGSVPAIIILGAYVFAHWLVLGGRYDALAGGMSFAGGVLRYITITSNAAVLCLLPLGTSMRHVAGSSVTGTAIAAVILLLWGLAVCKMKYARKLLVFSLAFFLVSLVPLVFVVAYFNVFAEHWMYLSNFAVLLFLAVLYMHIYWSRGALPKYICSFLLAGTIFFYASQARENSANWTDNETLTEHVLAGSEGDLSAMQFKVADLMSAGKKDLSLQAARDYVEKYPDQARSWYLKGRFAMDAGDLDMAEGDFIQALKCDALYDDAYVGLARVMLSAGDREGSIRYLRTALEINPGNVEALLLSGAVYSKGGQTREAMDMARRALKVRPYDYDVLVNAGTEYTRQGDVRRGARYYLMAADMYPERPLALYNLGYLFYTSSMKGGDHSEEFREQARYWLNASIMADPRFEPAAELLRELDGNHSRK